MGIRYEDLVHAIVWYASRRGEKLTTLRLVKFLYLADLYHARASKGKTLTDWPWAFVHFGPYCQEAMSAIDRAGTSESFQVNEQPSKYNDEKDYRLFWTEDVNEEPEVIGKLDIPVWSKLQWAIQKWADDSSGLLDYVYFETEPMIDAKPGELLDFGKARMPEPLKKVQMKKLSKKKVEEAKRAITELKEQYKNAITSKLPQGPTDALYFKAVRQLEGEDLEVGLKGKAELGDLQSENKP